MVEKQKKNYLIHFLVQTTSSHKKCVKNAPMYHHSVIGWHVGKFVMVLFCVLDKVRHFLLQLQHQDPVLGVLVEGADDELCEVGPSVVRVNFSIRRVSVTTTTVCTTNRVSGSAHLSRITNFTSFVKKIEFYKQGEGRRFLERPWTIYGSYFWGIQHPNLQVSVAS